MAEVVGIGPPDALRPFAYGASRTTGGGTDKTEIGRVRGLYLFALDDRDSAVEFHVGSQQR